MDRATRGATLGPQPRTSAMTIERPTAEQDAEWPNAWTDEWAAVVTAPRESLSGPTRSSLAPTRPRGSHRGVFIVLRKGAGDAVDQRRRPRADGRARQVKGACADRRGSARSTRILASRRRARRFSSHRGPRRSGRLKPVFSSLATKPLGAGALLPMRKARGSRASAGTHSSAAAPDLCSAKSDPSLCLSG